MAPDPAVVSIAYQEATKLKASPKVLLALFEAGLVESGFRNLPYGDRDSVGYLQQRPSQGWQKPDDVAYATGAFVRAAQRNEPNYAAKSAGALAQSVQRSAYPDKYDKQEQTARDLITKAGGLGSAPIVGFREADGGGLVDQVMAAAGALKTMSTGVVSVGGLATQLAKLALPSNVMRAVIGAAGIVFLFMGITFLGREVRR